MNKGRKPAKTYPIDKNAFMLLLKKKELSIRQIEKIPEFNYTAKSIGRALKLGRISYSLADSLSEILDVSLAEIISREELKPETDVQKFVRMLNKSGKTYEYVGNFDSVNIFISAVNAKTIFTFNSDGNLTDISMSYSVNVSKTESVR